jgi:hypothetical protein
LPDKSNAGTDGDDVTQTLWILAKDGHTMTCMMLGEPGHEELQVLLDREVYLSEMHTVHEGAVDRAQILHRGFEAHGWTPAQASS